MNDELLELKRNFMDAKTAEIEARANQDLILQAVAAAGIDSEIAKKVWTAEFQNKLKKLLTIARKTVEFCEY